MRYRRTLMIAAISMLGAAISDAQGVQFKVATLAPDGSFWMEEARQAAEKIERRTDGRVGFRFYPGGTMGNDDTVLRKMRIGQLHGGVLLAGSLGDLDPDFEIYNLPLIFRSYDEVDHVRRQLDQQLMSQLDDAGIVAFGLVETGFVYLMSTKPTRSFADLDGRKAWIPEGDAISKAIADAAGLAPVPLALSDVLTGLQTGLIDTVAAPPVGAVALQWFTKATYVTDLPLTYIYGTLVLSDRAFRKLGAEDQKVVREELEAMSSALNRRARTDNQQAREALAKQGVTFVTPTPETEKRWEQVADEARQELIGRQHYDRDLITEMERILDEYRERDQTAVPEV
jgi:TRAP-type C4-dicarboxylate transport system substrate-binding protein